MNRVSLTPIIDFDLFSIHSMQICLRYVRDKNLEEISGPALEIMVFDTGDEAVALVNDSDFGPGISVFTGNKARAEKLVPQF